MPALAGLSAKQKELFDSDLVDYKQANLASDGLCFALVARRVALTLPARPQQRPSPRCLPKTLASGMWWSTVRPRPNIVKPSRLVGSETQLVFFFFLFFAFFLLFAALRCSDKRRRLVLSALRRRRWCLSRRCTLRGVCPTARSRSKPGKNTRASLGQDGCCDRFLLFAQHSPSLDARSRRPPAIRAGFFLFCFVVEHGCATEQLVDALHCNLLWHTMNQILCHFI